MMTKRPTDDIVILGMFFVALGCYFAAIVISMV